MSTDTSASFQVPTSTNSISDNKELGTAASWTYAFEQLLENPYVWIVILSIIILCCGCCMVCLLYRLYIKMKHDSTLKKDQIMQQIGSMTTCTTHAYHDHTDTTRSHSKSHSCSQTGSQTPSQLALHVPNFGQIGGSNGIIKFAPQTPEYYPGMPSAPGFGSMPALRNYNVLPYDPSCTPVDYNYESDTYLDVLKLQRLISNVSVARATQPHGQLQQQPPVHAPPPPLNLNINTNAKDNKRNEDKHTSLSNNKQVQTRPPAPPPATESDLQTTSGSDMTQQTQKQQFSIAQTKPDETRENTSILILTDTVDHDLRQEYTLATVNEVNVSVESAQRGSGALVADTHVTPGLSPQTDDDECEQHGYASVMEQFGKNTSKNVNINVNGSENSSEIVYGRNGSGISGIRDIICSIRNNNSNDENKPVPGSLVSNTVSKHQNVKSLSTECIMNVENDISGTDTSVRHVMKKSSTTTRDEDTRESESNGDESPTDTSTVGSVYEAKLKQAMMLRDANVEYQVHLGFPQWGSADIIVPPSTIVTKNTTESIVSRMLSTSSNNGEIVHPN